MHWGRAEREGTTWKGAATVKLDFNEDLKMAISESRLRVMLTSGSICHPVLLGKCFCHLSNLFCKGHSGKQI